MNRWVRTLVACGLSVGFVNSACAATTVALPEPGTLALLGLGLLAIGIVRSRRR